MNVPTKPTPVKPSARIEVIDILRGFAIFGVLVMNMSSYTGSYETVDNWTWLAHRLVNLQHFLFEAKFYSMLSILFGLGMSIQMLRAEKYGSRFLPLFLRRMFILFLIGMAHATFLWIGDILLIYAICGVLLLFFRKLPPKIILAAALITLLHPLIISLPQVSKHVYEFYGQLTGGLPSAPSVGNVYATGTYFDVTLHRFWSGISMRLVLIFAFGNIFSMFLVGLYVGRRQYFQHITTHLQNIRRLMWVTLILGVLLNGLYVYVLVAGDDIPEAWQRLSMRGVRTLAAPSLAFFYITAIILLCQKEVWQKRLAIFAPVGRMALTNYLSHSLVLTTIFYGYGLNIYGEFGPIGDFLLSVAVFALQIKFSRWWLEHYRFGPAEWLWRSLAYGRLQPWRVDADNAPPSRLKTAAVAAALIFALGGILWRGWQALPQTEQAALGALAGVGPTATFEPPTPQPTPSPTPVLTPEIQPVKRGSSAGQTNLWNMAQAFDTSQALTEIETLTGPAYQGRQAGSPGGQAAGDYIAQQFAAYGLRPAGLNDTFFQPFPLPYPHLTAMPSLTITGPDGSKRAWQVWQDFAPLVTHYMGGGQGEGPVIWLNNCTHADFDLVNAVGKIAFCWDRLWLEEETDPGRNALEHGAAGLLLLSELTETRPLDQLSPYREVWVTAPLPTARVSPAAAQALLAGNGLSVDDLTLVFAARPLSTTVRLSIPLDTDEAARGRNVLAVLPGHDSAHRDELVILGAHYDHLGADPDGTIWPGANGNASGVAAMLEIARSWQAQGYVPRRSVLFAAWDAGEIDLNGATHYVDRPQFPITNTVTIAMLNLDMIGAGDDTLYIDGSGPVAIQAKAIAQSLGITATDSYNRFRNDHTPFAAVDVPVSLLSWVNGDEPESALHYHQPGDTPAAIEPDKLDAAGKLANLTLLALVDGEPAILDLVQKRVDAINNGDRAAFEQTGLPARSVIDKNWFAGIQKLTGAELSMELSGLQITGQVATATVHMELETGLLLGKTTHTAQTSINFLHQNDDWYWAGPPLHSAETVDGFALTYPPAHANIAPTLSRRARKIYSGLAGRLGLPPDTGASLILYPDSAALRADAGLDLPVNIEGLVDNGNGLSPAVRLAYSPAITRTHALTATLTHLLLTEAGVRKNDAPWLWQGLPMAVRTEAEPVAAYENYLSSLYEVIASAGGGQASTLQPNDSLHWAAVEFLREEVGWDGVGQFIRALGSGLSPDQAMIQTLGVDVSTFENRWRAAWQKRLTESQQQITDALNRRAQAVLAHNETDFLSTIAPADPTLLAEERAWLATLPTGDVQKFELSGRPVAFLPDDSVLVRVTTTYQLKGDTRPTSVPLTVRFTPTESGYRWAGSLFNQNETEHFIVHYPAGEQNLAQTLSQNLETTYGQLARRLLPPAEKITVKLYQNHHGFRASIALQTPGWVQSWTAPQQSLKLLLNESADSVDYQTTLAHQLARLWLAPNGATLNWLKEGLALYEASQTDRRLGREIEQQYTPLVAKLIRRDTLFSLTESLTPSRLSGEQAEDFYAQSWDTIRYLIARDGRNKLDEFLRETRQGQDVSAVFASIYDQSLTDFAAEWRASATRLHIDPALVELARTFAVTNATQSIADLTRPEFAGRQPGTAGSMAAAKFIAGQFEALGLAPAANDGSFFQRLPITYTALISAPQLLPLNQAGEPVDLFRHRQDFVTVQTDGAGGGQLDGEVVWIRGDVYGPVRLSGKVVLRRPVDTLDREIAQAIARDAAGLILVEDLTDNELQAKALYPQQPPPAWAEETGPKKTIPVVRLTNEAFERLLAVGGYTPTDVNNSPPAMPLDLRVRLAVPLAEKATTATNVLALLPGREPTRQGEVIIVGAHYDHVGNDPADRVCLVGGSCIDMPGFEYPGANDDASAIGVMLETIRLWQENGYQPARTILFAVWGAEELGEAGSGYYVAQPTTPLTETVAMIQLEAIGGGRGFWLQAEGDPFLDQTLRLTFDAAAQELSARLKPVNRTRGGSQTAFQQAGIPTLLIHWENAAELNLPAQTDDEIVPERLQQNGETVTLGLMMLSDW